VTLFGCCRSQTTVITNFDLLYFHLYCQYYVILVNFWQRCALILAICGIFSYINSLIFTFSSGRLYFEEL